MKYFSPFNDIVLVGPHKSVCNNSNGLETKYSFEGKDAFVCLPCWHPSQITFSGFLIHGITLTFWCLLTFTKLSKFKCPSLLCHNQLSFTYPIRQTSSWLLVFVISFKLYTFPLDLLLDATNCPHFNLILQPWSSKTTSYPWSQILVTLQSL